MPNAPDPVLGANGQVTFLGGAPTPTPEVQSACAAQIRAAQASNSTLPNVSASDMQALLRWGACMRANGLSRWPDPNAQGVFHVRSADAGTLDNRIGPLRIEVKLAHECGGDFEHTRGFSLLDKLLRPQPATGRPYSARAGAARRPTVRGRRTVCAYLEESGDDRVWAHDESLTVKVIR